MNVTLLAIILACYFVMHAATLFCLYLNRRELSAYGDAIHAIRKWMEALAKEAKGAGDD